MTRMTRQERLIRIELARTRAALERQNISRCLCDVHDALTPAGLWRTLFSGGRSRRSSSRRLSGIFTQLLSLSRRYPLLLGTASAALSSVGRGRRGLVWRIGLTALAGWKLFQRFQAQVPDATPATANVALRRDAPANTHVSAARNTPGN